MDGLSQDVLAFLIDIQEHGASQLRALSADFKSLGATADQIGGRLKALEGQLAKTATTATTTGDKVAASSRAQVAATDAQVAAAGKLTTAQRAQAGQAGAVAGATDRLTAAQKAQAGETRAAAGATASQASAQAQLAASSAGAAGALARHSAQVTEHTKRLQKLKSTSSEFGHVMNAVSLPLLATGGYAIKMGVDFEAAMSRLHTQAGYAAADVKALEGAVLKAAPTMRRTPTELAEGLYHVASVGIPARDALKVMQAAAVGANVGASNLSSTANGLVIVMKNMGQGAGSAREDMALLNEIVGAGNLHMEELVTSLGKVMPQARVFGLGIRDVGAAMDVLTARGMNANMAATRLAMSFNLLGAPKPAASKALAEIGISATQLGEDLHKPNGVLVAIQDLRSHLDRAFPPGRKLTVDEERKALEMYKGTLEAAGESGKKLTTHLEEFANKLAQTHSAATAQAGVLSAAFGGGRQSGAILALVQNVDDLRKTYNRLPEGAAALKRLQDAQDTWEKTSQGQLDAVKASFSTTMTSIGKNLAPLVLPVLKDIATDVEAITHAFEGLPKPVQHVAEAFVGLVAIAGPLAGLVSKFAGAALLVEKLRHGGGGVLPAGPLGTTTGTGVIGQVAAADRGIWGFKGPTTPGARLNPIAVLPIGGGLGGTGGTPGGGVTGPLTKEEAAARDAAAARGGAGLAGDAGLAAEIAGGGAAAASIGSKALAFGKTILGRLGPAAMVGLGGLAASELAGGLIGGKTGKAVSGVGNDAAFGAALGTMIEPGLGTAVGAALGAGFAGLKLLDGSSPAQKAGEVAGSGGAHGPHFDAQTRQYVEQAVTRSQEALGKQIAAIEAGAPRGQRGGPTGAGTRGHELSPTDTHQIAVLRQAGNLYQGQQAGGAEAKYVLGGVKYPELDSIIRVTRAKMSELAPIARRGYATMIRAAVEQLEREKRLPTDAIDKLNHEIASSFGSLSKETGATGALSMKALSAGLKGEAALGSARTLVEALRKTWSGIPAAANVTGREATGFFERTGTRLKQVIATTSGEQKQAAEKAYKELQTNAAGVYGAMVKESEANLSTLSHQSGPLSKQGTEAVERNYEQMRKAIETQVKLGVLSPKQGLAELAKATPPLALAATNPIVVAFNRMQEQVGGSMNAALTEVVTKLGQITAKTNAAVAHLIGHNAQTNLGNTPTPTGPGAGFGPQPGAPAGAGTVLAPAGATGMRVPGTPGPDNVGVYSPAGALRGVVAGGELLVANRHTEARVNRLLAQHGTSLGHEVAGEQRPHSAPLGYAFGGYVNPVPGLTLGRTDQGVDFTGAGPIEAMGRARLTRVSPQGSGTGWPGAAGKGTGAMIVYELLEGPDTGRDVYQAENIDPAPGLHTGMEVAAGRTIARARGAYPFLEIGFSDAAGTPISHGEYTEGKVTAGGQAFLSLLHGATGKASGGGAAAIKAPAWHGPGGVLGQIGRAIIAKATGAANARIARAQTTPSGGVGPAGRLGPPNKAAFAQYLAQYTGLPANFLTAWINHEQGATTVEGGNNWLNIETGEPGGGSGPYGASAKWVERHTPQQAAKIEAAWLRANLPQLLKARDASDAVRILESSGYAESHYNYESPASFLRAATGARFAGAFAQGGSVTADKPTLALFGENGRETATFVPHATTGAEIGAGIIPTVTKTEKPTEGLNPDNNQIESHTPAEWRSIRLHHSQAVKAAGGAHTVQRAVDVGGQLVGTITDKSGGTIDIPRDIGKLSAATWKKVMAAIDHTLKQTSDGAGLATQVTGELARTPGKRAREAAIKAIETTSKTVMSVFTKSPRNEEGAGGAAIGNLDKLIADAKREHAKTLVGELQKNVETVFTTAAAAIVKATEAPRGDAGKVDATAIGRLTALADRARKRGASDVEMTLRKDIEHTIAGWSSSVSSVLQRAQQVATRGAGLRLSQANLKILEGPPSRTTGPGAALRTNQAADPQFIAQQNAALAKAVTEYQREEASIGRLVTHERELLGKAEHKQAQLAAKMHAAIKGHHHKIAKALQAEITVLDKQIAGINEVLGEAGTQLEEVAGAIEEAQSNKADLAAEHLKAVYEAWVEQVHQAAEAFETARAHSGNREKIEEGERHLEGKDFSGLEEAKGKQEGVLTPAQIQQAQADLASYRARHEEQIRSDEKQLDYERSIVGGLSGAERTTMEQSIESLGVNIVELKDQIYDQTKATGKLTEATNVAAKSYGGTVGFEFQGQSYAVGGQSSVSAPDIMVGT